MKPKLPCGVRVYLQDGRTGTIKGTNAWGQYVRRTHTRRTDPRRSPLDTYWRGSAFYGDGSMSTDTVLNAEKVIEIVRDAGPDDPLSLARTIEQAVLQSAEVNRLREAQDQRDIAITMLADWCAAIKRNGTGWDDWDEHYKDAAFRPGPLRDLIDDAMEKQT